MPTHVADQLVKSCRAAKLARDARNARELAESRVAALGEATRAHSETLARLASQTSKLHETQAALDREEAQADLEDDEG